MKKILLSTDIGSDIDDALALLTMLNHSQIDLNGIYTVNGNTDIRSYIAKHMVDLSGKKIPVIKGESQPLDKGAKIYSFFEEDMVDEKFIESAEWTQIKYKPLKECGISEEGVDDLAQKAANSVIFNTGPLTNIAKLIQQHPEKAKQIEKIYLMGCRFPSPALEHNLRCDPVSAKIVFDSDIPMTIIPGNLCGEYAMPASFIDQMKSPAGEYVRRMARGFIASKTALEFQGLRSRGVLDYSGVPPGMIMNLDDLCFGAMEPEEYFEQYQNLIKYMEDRKFGKYAVDIMRGAIPNEISVADAYVPYCFLHQDKLAVERHRVDCDGMGNAYLLDGTKHEIVTSLDFKHFEGFLKEYLK